MSEKDKENQPVRRKRGRPTKYRSDFCAVARDVLGQGQSVMGLAGRLKVTVDTVYRWMKEHEEFSDAVARGKAGAVDFWEQRLVENALTGKGNAVSIMFGLKNRASGVWADKQIQEITGGDRPVVVERVDTTDSADFLASVTRELGSDSVTREASQGIRKPADSVH